MPSRESRRFRWSMCRYRSRSPAVVEPARGPLGLPEDDFIFLFAFDYNSVFKRKNPLDLIEAFTRAFAPGEGVQLVIKSINHERDPDSHDRLRIAAAPHSHVRLISQYLPALENQELMASCDAYVSLHRSEGFGIGMAEAILRGKPVVATGYGGNTDFLSEDTGYPVAHTTVPVGDDAWPYDPSAHWAQPDIDDAARQMRAVVEHPTEAARRVAQGQRHLRGRHSPEVAGERMLVRLEAIHAAQRKWASGSPKAAELPLLEELRLRMVNGVVPAERSRSRFGRGLARKALLRLIRPYTAHADRTMNELLEVVDQGVTVSVESADERALNASLATAAALADARRVRVRVDELEGEVRSAALDRAAADLEAQAVGDAADHAYPPAPPENPGVMSTRMRTVTS